MYATLYQTRAGFGSVAFIAGFDRRGQRLRLADPVLGMATVPAEQCLGLVYTEAGYVLPDVHPILIRQPVSEHLQPQAQLQRVANQELGEIWITPRAGGEAFPSGYPAAWQTIRRLREQISLDWRTIALVAIFGRTTIQRPIAEAEAQYHTFGPTLRNALLRGKVPTVDQIQKLKGVRAKSFELNDARAYGSILRWSPYVAEFLQSVGQNYGRDVRDSIALDYLPWGLGIIKLSFTMMLLGRDAACIDTRMQQYFLPSDRAIREWLSLVGARETRRVTREFLPVGARGITPNAVLNYRRVEDRLAWTPYFDPDWPQPYAKAQWMLWETLGRTAGTASHAVVAEVLGPLIQEVTAEVGAA